jgi:hypothetical protein
MRPHSPTPALTTVQDRHHAAAMSGHELDDGLKLEVLGREWLRSSSKTSSSNRFIVVDT